ncbi:MAG: O-antigen ligase domain-containing protein [Blastocatellia bacterium]|nr:O-antigen ligase domain-containing protein [Blastocatellia bacterium]
MEIIVLIPGVISAWIAFTQSPQRAFLDVYLPVLFFLPEYYRWIAPGLPDPTFSQAVVIPIFLAFWLRSPVKWKFSLADGLVFGFAFCVGYSEYLNAGYNEAQNLMVDMVCWVTMPYVLAKGLIEPTGIRIDFAKRLVWVVFLVSVISVYEFKMGVTPFSLILDRFFPGQGGWVTTFRYGFARIAGPYGHAILAGVVIICAFLIQLWLQWSNQWEAQFRKFHLTSLSKATLISLGILGGSIMTMCRGPWIGGVLGLGAMWIGRSKNRKRSVLLLLAGVLLIGVPLGISLWNYASVGRANAQSESQETAAYRKELIDKYVDIAVERSTWGWGRNTWPKVPGMPSIDNYFLLLALMHGLVALGFLLAIFLVMIGRLFRFEMSHPPAVPPGSSPGFLFIGVYVAIFASIATVFLGGQTIPLLFLMTGWAEGYLVTGKPGMAGTGAQSEPDLKPRFRRVLS